MRRPARWSVVKRCKRPDAAQPSPFRRPGGWRSAEQLALLEDGSTALACALSPCASNLKLPRASSSSPVNRLVQVAILSLDANARQQGYARSGIGARRRRLGSNNQAPLRTSMHCGCARYCERAHCCCRQ